MAKKKIKDKDGNLEGIKVTGKDAEKLWEDIQKEERNTDMFTCSRCEGRTQWRYDEEKGRWVCQRCGKKIGELEKSLQKEEDLRELQGGFETAIDKVLGKYNL